MHFFTKTNPHNLLQAIMFSAKPKCVRHWWRMFDILHTPCFRSEKGAGGKATKGPPFENQIPEIPFHSVKRRGY